MLNQVVIVGRLQKIEKKEEKYISKIIVPQSFKNESGEYGTDIIKFEMVNNIGENVIEFCKEGDLIGIKGRLTSYDDEEIIVVAEKVTFLSNNTKKEEE